MNQKNIIQKNMFGGTVVKSNDQRIIWIDFIKGLAILSVERVQKYNR